MLHLIFNLLIIARAFPLADIIFRNILEIHIQMPHHYVLLLLLIALLFYMESIIFEDCLYLA